MDLLNRRAFQWSTLLFGLVLTSCGPSNTFQRFTYLETDTTIRNDQDVSRALDTTLSLQNSGGIIQRSLVKLPTGKGSIAARIDQGFADPNRTLLDAMNSFAVLPVTVLQQMFGCQDATLTASKLVSSVLTFDFTTTSPGLTGQVSLDSITQPWWNSATWTRAHPFSKNGNWTTAGGSTGSTVASSVESANNLTFDLTSYLGAAITAGGLTSFYGFMLRPAGSFSEVKLVSGQGSGVGQRPRIVSTYNCTSTSVARTGTARTESVIYYLDRGVED